MPAIKSPSVTVTEIFRPPRTTFVYENIRAFLGYMALVVLVWGLGALLRESQLVHQITVVVSILATCILAGDIVLNYRQQRFFTIQIVEGQLIMNRGRFIRTRTVIVPGAILSVDLVHGPLLRKLGLMIIKLNGIAHFPEILALSSADAASVQTVLTKSVAAAQEKASDETGQPSASPRV